MKTLTYKISEIVGIPCGGEGLDEMERNIKKLILKEIKQAYREGWRMARYTSETPYVDCKRSLSAYLKIYKLK